MQIVLHIVCENVTLKLGINSKFIKIINKNDLPATGRSKAVVLV